MHFHEFARTERIQNSYNVQIPHRTTTIEAEHQEKKAHTLCRSPVKLNWRGIRVECLASIYTCYAVPLRILATVFLQCIKFREKDETGTRLRHKLIPQISFPAFHSGNWFGHSGRIFLKSSRQLRWRRMP